MDCVGCEKCKLWGKLQTEGLGAAFKILFTDVDSADAEGAAPFLDRAEMVAFVHTLAAFADSVEQTSHLSAAVSRWDVMREEALRMKWASAAELEEKGECTDWNGKLKAEAAVTAKAGCATNHDDFFADRTSPLGAVATRTGITNPLLIGVFAILTNIGSQVVYLLAWRPSWVVVLLLAVSYSVSVATIGVYKTYFAFAYPLVVVGLYCMCMRRK